MVTNKRRAKDATKMERMETWLVFIGLCKFFSFTHNDIYWILKSKVDLDVWYTDYIRFRYTLVNNPVALVNKDDVREVVEHYLSKLKDDMFTVMNKHSKYIEVRAKWEGIIGD